MKDVVWKDKIALMVAEMASVTRPILFHPGLLVAVVCTV